MKSSLSDVVSSPVVVTATVLAGIVSGCTSPSLPEPASNNPLPPCPASPNCVRSTETVGTSPKRLYAAALKAMDAIGPQQVQVDPDRKRASAVYRVGFIFKDDLSIAVEQTKGGSLLHVRSASRVGYSDLGVNARRVRRLLREVRTRL